MEQKTLNQWRKERNLSTEEVAQGLDLTVLACRNVLNYSKTASKAVAQKLLKVLNVTHDQVIWKQKDIVLPAMPKSAEAEPMNEIVSPEQYEVAVEWLDAGRSKAEIAAAMAVSRETLSKALRRYESGLPPENPNAQRLQQQHDNAAKAREDTLKKLRAVAIK